MYKILSKINIETNLILWKIFNSGSKINPLKFYTVIQTRFFFKFKNDEFTYLCYQESFSGPRGRIPSSELMFTEQLLDNKDSKWAECYIIIYVIIIYLLLDKYENLKHLKQNIINFTINALMNPSGIKVLLEPGRR